jgi:AcrR family transcriptional regulator
MLEERSPEDDPLSDPLETDEGSTERFLELASQRFLNSGYAATTVRDLAREGGVTIHFVYKTFKDKAGVLSAVVRWSFDRDTPAPGPDGTLAAHVRDLAASFSRRARVRALAVEFASAARRDSDARDAMAAWQTRTMGKFLDFYRKRQARGEIDRSIDPADLLSLLWAAEFGFGVLETIGIDPGDPDQIARLFSLLIDSVS